MEKENVLQELSFWIPQGSFVSEHACIIPLLSGFIFTKGIEEQMIWIYLGTTREGYG
jgi:hypothetical protein